METPIEKTGTRHLKWVLLFKRFKRSLRKEKLEDLGSEVVTGNGGKMKCAVDDDDDGDSSACEKTGVLSMWMRE